MPPVPEISHESDAPINAADLLAGYRITSKPRSVGIKEGITRALGAAKKRGRAMKLGHEAKSLQTAIEAQLEALGTLTLAHRPGTVDIGQQVADLSQVQDEVSQKESMLNALRQTKGSAPVAKELSKEVAQLHIRQKAAMIAIGRKALGVRPDMPGAAGCYGALDRLQSSLDVKRGQRTAIEDEIGPVWQTSGMSLGATKGPLLLVGAAVGGLLLICLLWKFLSATLPITGVLASGYQLDCMLDSDECGNVWIDATATGKAAKVAMVLVYPGGKSDVLVIEENDMITNCARRRFPIEPEAGRYILTLKTFIPEAVVCTREVALSPTEFEVEVKDVSVGIVPCAGVDRDYLGKELDVNGVKIFVRKRGTLPLRFTGVSLSADGQRLGAGLSKAVVGAGTHVVEVAATTWAQRVILRRGARCVVEGQLFYGKDGKSSLPFRKEFVLQ